MMRASALQGKHTAMNLKIKLGLLFGSLTLLLIVSAVLSYLLVKRIDNDVQSLERVVEPLIEAALVTEIKSIIQYSIDGDERQIRRIIETKIDFAKSLEGYARLAETEGAIRVNPAITSYGTSTPTDGEEETGSSDDETSR